MAKIMVRTAEDDFVALKTAQGMENAGANVFSITNSGSATHFGATVAHVKFVVWAKIENYDMISAVDKAIEKEIDS